jgi:hypothetical protein
MLSLVGADVPAKISYMVGSVIIERGGTKYAGVLNATLLVDDIVTTYSESSCEIQFSTYSLVRLEPNSSMKIERKEQTKKGFFQSIFATMGDVVTKVTKLNKNDEVQVKTDAAQAYIRGTVLKTSIDKEGGSSFSVFAGKVKVKSIVKGAKEIALGVNSRAKIGKGQVKALVEKLPKEEIEKFASNFKEFLNRGAELDKMREKLEKELKESKDKLMESGEKKLKSCIFW